MSSQDIRLRLTIRRHALPEVKLIWPCTASEDLTIAKLLSSVNDVVPLEGEQWGLEDYSVELNDGQGGGSFECLHFQQVRQVLKHDDQVLIRSLLTDDIKRRRLSGRHQISYDGKHLVDGVAFGRPWLRTPRDRPAVNLPPRKRARIEYHPDEEEEDVELDNVPERLLLENSSSARLLSDPADQHHFDDESSEDDDADYNPDSTIIRRGTEASRDDNSVSVASEDDGSGLEEEIRLLQEDNDIVGDDDVEPSPAAPPAAHQTTIPDFTANFARAMRAPIAAFKKSFPLTSEREIQAALLRHAQDLRSTYAALEAEEAPELSFDEVMDEILQLSLDVGAESEQSPALPSPKRPLIQEVEDLSEPPARRTIEEIPERDDASRSGDSGSESEGPIIPQPARGIIEEVIAESDAEGSDDNSFEDGNGLDLDSPGSSSSSSADDSSESDTSDSDSDMDTSDEESDEDGGVHHRGRSLRRQAARSLDSSSEDSSDSSSDESSDDDSSSSSDETSSSEDDSSSDSESDSDSEPDEVAAKPAVVAKKTRSAPPAADPKPTSTPKPTTSTPSAQDASESQVGPGQGLTKTQKRNLRRREAKQKMRVMDQQSGSTPTDAAAEGDADFAARKKALLEAVAADDSAPPPEAPAIPHTNQTPQSDHQSQQQGEESAKEQPQRPGDAAKSDAKESEGGNAATSQDDTPRRRMRMDLGASKRMLFGALGLKNPKTKADEEKLKQDLMKDVRPLKNYRQEVETAKGPEEGELAPAADGEEDEDEDAWRSKITYRAVECCHDGIVLSEPPFPFVQRWDPQQRYSSMRKRKRNSQNFHQGDYYEDDSVLYGEAEDPFDSGRSQKKTKTSKKGKGGKAKEDATEDVELNYDDPPASTRGADSQMTDLDDLPSLPKDVSALPALEATAVKPGMVITWKQLLLSKATNWQPEVSAVTGLVVSLDSDNVLHLVLAKRDRDEEKTYDEETGQRIYDRFEVPSDSENEDGGEDDGHREIPWSDLIEPRIVQAEPTTSTFNTPRKPAAATEHVVAEDANGSGDKSQDKSRGQLVSPEDTSHTMDVDGDQDHQSADSLSIPSGQNGQSLDFSGPSIEAPTTSGESGDKISQTQSVDGPGPLASSQASSQVNVFPPSSSLVKDVDATSQDQAAGPDGATKSPESGSVSSYQDAEPSLESLPMIPPSDEEDGQRTPTVSQSHVQITEPSSATSNRSGRQMDAKDAGVGSLDEDEIIPDTNQSAHETTPKASAPPSAAESSKGSSPFFPSIEEIWHTAATSRQTQSPFKSSQMSVLRRGRAKNDEEYQAAMQRLDEGDESDSLPDLKNKSIRNLFPNATQPSPVVDEPVVKREHVRPSSSFQVPEGSQVIMLSSSSPPAEDYADDSVDETYGDREEDREEDISSPPRGAGWVTKNKPSRDTRSRSRGKSVPASAAPKAATASQASTTKNRAPLLSANAVFGRRKSSGRKF